MDEAEESDGAQGVLVELIVATQPPTQQHLPLMHSCLQDLSVRVHLEWKGFYNLLIAPYFFRIL